MSDTIEQHAQESRAPAANEADVGAAENVPISPRARMSRRRYEREKRQLQIELLKWQAWVKETGQRVVVLFEGRDAAGKGGAIKRFMEHLNPRGARVVALEKPSDTQRTQWYFQRYVEHLPAAGEIVMFDRSWYNRAGVERVMGFCSTDQTTEFLKNIPLLEKAMVSSGIILLKYWLEVSESEQTRRLQARIDDGRKVWKLSPMDLKSYSRWYDYSRARDEMFAATDTSWAPWHVVPSDDKNRARLNLITHLLGQIPYKDVPREKIKLPKRQKPGDYRETNYPFKYVEEKF